jgi:hypothetical protein
VDVEMRRLNGDVLMSSLLVPDEVAALVLKASATSVRTKGTDFVDIWRCLEVANAASVRPEHFESDEEHLAAKRIRELFDIRTSLGMEAIVAEQRLSGEGAERRLTRIRALIERALP